MSLVVGPHWERLQGESGPAASWTGLGTQRLCITRIEFIEEVGGSEDGPNVPGQAEVKSREGLSRGQE